MDLTTTPRHELERMARAGKDILECYRILAKTGDNVVSEVLKGQGPFVQYTHYPENDAYDRETASQYYYHAHRDGEHGHFHAFLREKGMPAGIRPAPQSDAPYRADSADSLCHLIAISMDSWGIPIGIFTTNRWVVADTWYAAVDVARMLDVFEMDTARPSWVTNRWITAMIRLFRPQINALLTKRDQRIQAAIAKNPGIDVFEDRNLETIAEARIDVMKQIRAVNSALDRQGQSKMI